MLDAGEGVFGEGGSVGGEMVDGEPTEIAAEFWFVDVGCALDVTKVNGEENFEIIFSDDLADENLLEILLVDDNAEFFFGFANDTFGEGFAGLEVATTRGVKLVVHIAGVGAFLEEEFGVARDLASKEKVDSDMN